MKDAGIITEYVLLMLGHPVITVELDQNQIDLAMNESEQYVTNSERIGHKIIPPNKRKELIQEGTLYKSQAILAKIRLADFQDRYKKSKLQLLQNEAMEECFRWKKRVKNATQVNLKLFSSVLCSLLSNPKVDPKNAVELTWDILRKIDPNIKPKKYP